MSSDGQKTGYPTTKPLLDNSSLSNPFSYSSESSDESSGKTSLNLETISASELENEPTEDQLLLSYNTHKKYGKNEDPRKPRPSLFKQAVVQSQEIVL